MNDITQSALHAIGGHNLTFSFNERTNVYLVDRRQFNTIVWKVNEENDTNTNLELKKASDESILSSILDEVAIYRIINSLQSDKVKSILYRDISVAYTILKNLQISNLNIRNGILSNENDYLKTVDTTVTYMDIGGLNIPFTLHDGVNMILSSTLADVMQTVSSVVFTTIKEIDEFDFNRGIEVKERRMINDNYLLTVRDVYLILGMKGREIRHNMLSDYYDMISVGDSKVVNNNRLVYNDKQKRVNSADDEYMNKNITLSEWCEMITNSDNVPIAINNLLGVLKSIEVFRGRENYMPSQHAIGLGLFIVNTSAQGIVVASTHKDVVVTPKGINDLTPIINQYLENDRLRQVDL